MQYEFMRYRKMEGRNIKEKLSVNESMHDWCLQTLLQGRGETRIQKINHIDEKQEYNTSIRSSSDFFNHPSKA